MLLKHVALTAATIALCAAVNAAPAAAQAPNCGDMYNRVMQLYQAAPQSPEYAQMSANYNASCIGPSAGSAYPSPSYPAGSYPADGYPAASYPAASYPAAGYGYSPAYVSGPPISVGVGFGYGGGWGGGWRR
jgi:hypothetical protein